MKRDLSKLIQKVLDKEAERLKDSNVRLESLIREGFYKRLPNGFISVTEKGRERAKAKAMNIAKEALLKN